MTDIDQVNPWALPSTSIADLALLPDCAAIYFVIQGSTIIYIGKAVRLATRWKRHHRLEQVRSEYPGSCVAWLELTRRDPLEQIEKALILRLNPKLNRTPSIEPPKSNTAYSKRVSIRFTSWFERRLIWQSCINHLPMAAICQNMLQEWIEDNDSRLQSMIQDMATDKGLTVDEWKSRALKKHGYS